MNRNLHRVIFSAVRAVWMAVQETATGFGKGRAAGTSGSATRAYAVVIDMLPMRAAAFAALCMLGLQPVLVEAQVVVSPTATGSKPVVGVSASGLPVVQIATPNTAGVSNNTYSQFNVGTPGLILNNSSGNVLTQTAGYVTGNPNLAPGSSARVILNQVVSGAPSQLLGYMEVAGQSADVIVANPSGIYCNGCGFINTSRGVLTTGTPVFGGSGSLDAFHVTGGQIQIDSSGLNAASIDQVDLIARSVEVNGKVWANKALNVVAGANDVQYGNLAATALTPDANQPAVAIDVAQLGGMYAGKITLVGTEAGVGVNSTGTIAAQAGDVQISSQGQVTLAGATSASGNVSVNAASDISNTGSAYAGQDLNLTSLGQVGSSGTVAALGNTTINAVSVNSTGSLGAGIDSGGNVSGSGSLSVLATGAVTATGQNLAAGNATLTGSSLNLSGADTSAGGNVALTATAGNITQTGAALSASGALTVSATGAWINDQGATSAAGLGISAASISNRGGALIQTGAGTTTLTTGGTLDNTGGVIATNGENATIQAGSLTNVSGQIGHAGSGILTVQTGALDNTQGQIGTNAQAAIQAASIENASGTLTSAQALNVTTGNLDNTAGTVNAGGALDVTATDVQNTAGRVVSQGTDGLNLSVSGQIVNASGTTALGATGGVIGGNGNASVQAASFANSGTVTSAQALDVSTSGTLDNSGGTLTASTLSASAASLKNAGGTINASAVTVTAPQLDNTSGQIAANQLTLNATNLTNGQGTIAQFGTSAMGVNVSGMLDNSNGTLETNSTDLTLAPAQLNNTGGTIVHAGTGTLTVEPGSGQAALTNVNGEIATNGQAVIAASSLNNSGGQISGENVQINAGALDNTSGVIGNVVGAVGDIGITTGTLTNTSGRIGASQDLQVTATTLAGGGSYSAVNDLGLNLQGDFTTAPAYAFSAGHNLTFTLPGTFTNGGLMLAVNNLGINAWAINNSGTLMAGGQLDTQSVTLANTGTIVGGSVTLAASQGIQNTGPGALIGATDSAGTLALLAPVISNVDDVTLTDTAPTTALFGLGNVVLAGGKDASGNYINASLIDNESALIQSAGDMTLKADQVTNTRRVVQTSGLTSSVDSSLLDSLGISLSGCTSMYMPACSGAAAPWGLPGDPTLIGGVYIEPPHGDQWNSTYEYTTYTGVAVANTVTTISPQGQIVSGGNLDASSVGNFRNYWSAVTATGDIAMPVNLDQDSWQGQTAPEVVVTYSGEYHYNNYDNSEHNWQLPFGNAGFVTSNPGGYTAAPADIRTYALPGYESTFTAQGTISGSGVTINNTAGNAGVPPLGLKPGQDISGGPASTVSSGIANADNPVIASATAGKVLDNIQLPSGGLFHVDTAPNAPYLIETNPAFTNQQQWLSSDYYFQQMGMDPSQIQMRLGDGFYEQQLVQQQVLALTGQSVLTNYASTQDEYEALMTAGVHLAQSLNLAPGTGLSPDQVAQLTSNVVIMETEVVDGQSVLVPVVYLAQASQQNMGNGPVIAATNIDLQNAQSVTSSGTIAASNNLTLTAQSINSTDGTLQSGNQMTLVSAGDVNLTSATLNAGSLGLLAGGNLILDTAANTQNQVTDGGATRSNTTLGPTASINVANDAAIVTGGNFEQDAGNLNVGGSLGMSIGGNWTLGTQETGETKVVRGASGVSDTHYVSDTGSTVSVGGVSQIAVGGDLTATGANINLGGGGTIAVNGDVTLQAAVATSTLDSSTAGSYHGRTYSEQIHRSNDVVTGTTLTGGQSVTIASGKDINILGSSVDLTQGTATLAAAGDVNVGTVTETHVSNMSEKHSHSGFLSSSSGSSTVDQTLTTADGSTISADSVSISSGKDINVTGSAVVGTNQVSLAAQDNVNITAATDTWQDSEYHQEKHSGLSGSGGLGITIGSSEQSDRYNGSSVTQSQSRSTVGTVEGNVAISAGTDVHVSGSDVIAGKAVGDVSGATGNISIAGQNVTIDPGQDSAQSNDQQEAHSSGLTLAVTGTPYDTVRNLIADGSSGNAFQRAQSVVNELGASALDVPSISVSFGSSHSSSTTDMSSLTNAGSTIRGGGNVTVSATGGAVKDANGQSTDGDLSVIGSTISAGGTTTLSANHDVNLQASTDQLQQSTQSNSSSSGFSLATPSLGDVVRWIGGTANTGGTSPSPYNASRSNSNGTQAQTTQTATVVSGNSVVVQSQTGDVNVVGSGISGTQGVDVVASQGAINVLAGLDTASSHQESSSSQIGSLGSNGTATGFSVGVASSHSVQDTASQNQSTMRSQIVSANGNVTLDAKQDVTVAGSDLGAGQDLTLIGRNVNLDPGTDAMQSTMSQSSSQFGVSLALGGAVGNAIATVNQSLDNASHVGDSRLAALDTAQAGLAVYNAYQVATATRPTAQPLIKATVSVGGGTSHSESQSSTLTNAGSALTAGGTVNVVATGSGATDASGNATDGDITARGTQISGQDVVLNAARDINLLSAQDTSQQSGSNSSTGGSIGVGVAIGGQQNGFTLELGASASRGNSNGQSVTNRDTQISAGDTLSMTSGRDTTLRGAEVSGNTVDASVGRDLNIQSPQDTSTYNSKQSSAGFQASICVPPFCVGQTVSGSASVSQQTIKDNFQSVNEQSGIYAGNGGFDVNVGNHTQLDGGVIASTASAEKNSLTTQTFGFTNLQNTASYSGSAVGFSVSGGFGQSTPGGVNLSTPVTQTGSSKAGPVNSQGLGPSGFSAAGTGSSASGTTYAAVSPGTITVRGDAGTGQDSTAGLSRDTANANGAVANTFDAQSVQNDLAVQQQAGQVGMQVVGDVATALENSAAAKEAAARLAFDNAQKAGDEAGMAQAQADITAAQQQEALWGNDGTARIASHAIVAGLGAALGGGSVAGAVGGTVAGDIAGNVAGQALDGTLGGALLSNIVSGAAGAAVGGALGGSTGAMSGANGALSADLYNRQLHPDERKLISDKAHQMALEQAQSPDDVAKIEAYWTNVLTLVADADVDSQARQQLGSQLNQMAQAAQASGNTQAYQQFVQALQTAQQAIQGMAGQTITSNGGPIVADDGLLKTFQPTGSQFNDASLFGTPGGTRVGLAIGETPASAGIGSQYYIAPNGPTNQQVNSFANDVLQQIGTPNGVATPVYPLENLVLGGAGGKIVSGVLGKLFGAGATDGAQVIEGATAGNGEGIFAGAQLGTYTPKSSVFGQAYDFSCVAASCKMAAGLSDVPESYIRQAIQTDTSGTSLSNIPGGLQQLGFTGTATYAKNATVASIESATDSGALVIANVTTESGGIHAIVVDSVKGGVANIRDPWPLGVGSTYSVPVDALGKALTGSVVVIHP